MHVLVSEPENLTENSGNSDDEWTIQENISKRQQTFDDAMYVFLDFHRVTMFIAFVLQSKG